MKIIKYLSFLLLALITASAHARWLSVDPVGFKESNPASFNRYAYANNNPYKYVDPDGKEAKIVTDGNKINITIPITFTGNGASSDVVSKFISGIESSWSGTFGKYQVETKVTEGKDNIIEVPKGDGQAIVTGTNRGNWPSERPEWTAGHEAGHLMGLADGFSALGIYPGFLGNIMGQRGGTADERNISGILSAPSNTITEKAKDK
jgi:hypothetical protein